MSRRGPRYFGNILVQRAASEGFIVLDYAERFPEAMKALAAWYTQGKISTVSRSSMGSSRRPPRKPSIRRLHHGKLMSGREEPRRDSGSVFACGARRLTLLQ